MTMTDAFGFPPLMSGIPSSRGGGFERRQDLADSRSPDVGHLLDVLDRFPLRRRRPAGEQLLHLADDTVLVDAEYGAGDPFILIENAQDELIYRHVLLKREHSPVQGVHYVGLPLDEDCGDFAEDRGGVPGHVTPSCSRLR